MLFRTAAETMHTIAANPKHLGGEIGFLAVLHTWGQNQRPACGSEQLPMHEVPQTTRSRVSQPCPCREQRVQMGTRRRSGNVLRIHARYFPRLLSRLRLSHYK